VWGGGWPPSTTGKKIEREMDDWFSMMVTSIENDFQEVSYDLGKRSLFLLMDFHHQKMKFSISGPLRLKPPRGTRKGRMRWLRKWNRSERKPKSPEEYRR